MVSLFLDFITDLQSYSGLLSTLRGELNFNFSRGTEIVVMVVEEVVEVDIKEEVVVGDIKDETPGVVDIKGEVRVEEGEEGEAVVPHHLK